MSNGHRERLLGVLAQLEAMHGWQRWHWDSGTEPFEIIVGSILVQNTMWTNAERTIDRLKAAGMLAPGKMSLLSMDELAELIRPSGQFRQKAKRLRAFLELAEAHGSLQQLLALAAPDLRAKLLATWGIGPETADVIVLYAAKQPSFVIDAYTMRLFRRLGIGPESASYADWQRFFVDALPEDQELWARMHALIVTHCKFTCRKLSPACGSCTLNSVCPAAEVTASGRGARE